MLFRILEGRARPARIQEIFDLLVQQGEEVVAKSEGVLFLQVLNSGEDIMAVTSWRSLQHMETYLSNEKTKAFYRRLPPLLMGIHTVRTFDVVKTVTGKEALDAEAAHWVRT